MLTYAPDTAETPWDQLVDLKDGTVITKADDGAKIPLRAGGRGVVSPFATDSAHRAIRFTTGGIAYLGVVGIADCENLRPIAPPIQSVTVTGSDLSVGSITVNSQQGG